MEHGPKTPLARARHALRGKVNALKLCISALAVTPEPEEALEFLNMIDDGTDSTLTALDEFELELERAPEHERPPQESSPTA